jgi:hypothetical protein
VRSITSWLLTTGISREAEVDIIENRGMETGTVKGGEHNASF